MAAAPAFYFVNLSADAKAEVRFHKMEFVEAQAAEEASKPIRQLTVFAGHNFAGPNVGHQGVALDQISEW